MVNAFTHVQTASFPALHTKFAFAALLEKTGESAGTLSLRFVRERSQEDEVLLTADANDQSRPMLQFYMNFPLGLRLLEDGLIKFRIEVSEGDGNWSAVSTQSIQVSRIDPQNPNMIIEPADNEPAESI